MDRAIDRAMDRVMGTPAVAGPGFPRLALGSAWLLTALGIAALGWQRAEPTLIAAAAIAGAATVAVISNRFRDVTLRFSGAAGIALVAAGIATAHGVGVIPLIAGIVTARLSRRAWVMSR
jgi:hypothetical protein